MYNQAQLVSQAESTLQDLLIARSRFYETLKNLPSYFTLSEFIHKLLEVTAQDLSLKELFNVAHLLKIPESKVLETIEDLKTKKLVFYNPIKQVLSLKRFE